MRDVSLSIFVCMQSLDGVNGPLMSLLADTIGFHDGDCVNMLQHGGDVVSDSRQCAVRCAA